MMRLDKFLSHSGFGTRKEVRKMIKKGTVIVNNKLIKKDDLKIDENCDDVYVNNRKVEYNKYIYIMLNKPSGYVCANSDNIHDTVFKLLNEYNNYDLFCVGRLDIDTTGLLLVTNDGDFAHKLTSPRKKVKKVYEALVDGFITNKDIDYFLNGVIINDDYKCLPADLSVISVNNDSTLCQVVIEEGKFHQVKKMFKSINLNVILLKRTKISKLELDSSLDLGEYRFLSKEEVINFK